MKKVAAILIGLLLFAQESLYYETPVFNIPDTNTSEINSTKNSETKSVFDNNETIKEEEIVLEDNFVSLKPHVKVCVVINKKRFFKFVPSIINSLNAYLIYKDVDYELKVFDINESIEKINGECNDTIIYSLNKKYIQNLSEYNNSKFYIPIFNKKEIETNTTNLYFGGIDYKEQINKLAEFIDDNKAISINENTNLSNKLFKYENELNLTIIPYEYPNINYNDLNNSFVFFNTRTAKTAQVLSKITYYELETKLQLASQINYDPLLIGITQPDDVKKLIIANSIIHPPLLIEDYNLIINTDIKYNWLNYASNILLNKIYNNQTGEENFYMNDFKTYIFDNQILYKIKLYQIINGAFKEVR